MSTSTDNLKGDFVTPSVELLPGEASEAGHHLVEEAHAGHLKDGVIVDKDQPIWYLAYGSNLCSKVFKNRRGISPIDKRDVFVPGLELTFNLAGVPFSEPCFANARFATSSSSEKAASTSTEVSYDWEAPWTGRGALLGVAYLVSPDDFGRILATEGGGGSYQMVAVDAHVLACDAFPDSKRHSLTGETLRAFTLVSPEGSPRNRDPALQPSLRYLNLIRAGAEEHGLPLTYRAYLKSLRHYESNTLGRKLGKVINMILFFPILYPLITSSRFFANADGSWPACLMILQISIFRAMWTLHDWVLKPYVGDGETGFEDEKEKEREKVD